MNIAVLGTGMVGRAHAAKLSALGNSVVMGTRDVKKTLEKRNGNGLPPLGAWLEKGPKIRVASFADAAAAGEIVIEAIFGEAVFGVLEKLGKQLSGKVLVDIANPLDGPEGMPPTLFVANTDSLGERIQRALPATRVVKAFNTMTAGLQVDPGRLGGGNHELFISGNDDEAKSQVVRLARSYGWKTVTDLGDITGCRGQEMLMTMWIRLWGIFQDPNFNFKVVRA